MGIHVSQGAQTPYFQSNGRAYPYVHLRIDHIDPRIDHIDLRIDLIDPRISVQDPRYSVQDPRYSVQDPRYRGPATCCEEPNQRSGPRKPQGGWSGWVGRGLQGRCTGNIHGLGPGNTPPVLPTRIPHYPGTPLPCPRSLLDAAYVGSGPLLNA